MLGCVMAACGGGSSSSDSNTDTAARVDPDVGRDVSAHELEHALLAKRQPPRPTKADCRRATPAERRHTPFGDTQRPLFSCVITTSDERARYTVQVLRNGCFVAERDRPGRAVYACV